MMLLNPFVFGAGSGSGDPYWANTVLLVGPSDVVGSVTVTDESPAAHGTFNSDGGSNQAQVQDSIPLFGAPTMRFDAGFNDSFIGPDSDDWHLSTGDFTIECFAYFDGNTANQTLVSHYYAGINQRAWSFQYSGGLTPDQLRFVGSSNGQSGTTVNVVTGNWTPTAATWYYLCAERSGTTVRLYVGELGGTASMLAKATSSIDLFNSTTALRIGIEGGDVSGFNGNMGEVRITKGVARYNTDAGFAVPTDKFPRS